MNVDCLIVSIYSKMFVWCQLFNSAAVIRLIVNWGFKIFIFNHRKSFRCLPYYSICYFNQLWIVQIFLFINFHIIAVILFANEFQLSRKWLWWYRVSLCFQWVLHIQLLIRRYVWFLFVYSLELFLVVYEYEHKWFVIFHTLLITLLITYKWSFAPYLHTAHFNNRTNNFSISFRVSVFIIELTCFFVYFTFA